MRRTRALHGRHVGDMKNSTVPPPTLSPSVRTRKRAVRRPAVGIASLGQPLVDSSSGSEPDEPDLISVPPEDASKPTDSQRPKVRRTFELVNRIGSGKAKTPRGSEPEQNLVEAAPNLRGEPPEGCDRLGGECYQRHLGSMEPESPAYLRIGHGRPFELLYGPFEERLRRNSVHEVVQNLCIGPSSRFVQSKPPGDRGRNGNRCGGIREHTD
jgi:hypothetical protein